jgi:hypothetical protein
MRADLIPMINVSSPEASAARREAKWRESALAQRFIEYKRKIARETPK